MRRNNLPQTLPLPWPPEEEPRRAARVHAIAGTARALDEARLAWLANLHAALDRAVWTATCWDDAEPARVPEDDMLARLLELNLERAGR